ncbi:MAG TPA: cytochrome c oxidase subunit II [Opitutaceae bacterium]|nr:cytochrome c oxidase subunit II [Opitutaceae bacterium]
MFLKSLLPTSRAEFNRWTRAVLAVSGLALLAGCKFTDIWRMDGHQSTLDVAGPVALAQRHVFYVTCWVTFTIFILVGSTLAYATLKFRARSSDDQHAPPPPQSHGNPLVELSLIALSVGALVIIAVPTLKGIWYTYDVPVQQKGEALEVNATGYQWWWRFEYPTEEATVSGTVKMPLVTANELVIPAGRPIRINLRTNDVIHSFWVPKLAGKVDMIPNRANFLWLEASQPGYFWGQCAEFCGDSHAVMRFRVIALPAKEFSEWLEQQSKPARDVEPGPTHGAVAKAQFASLRLPDDFRPNETGVTGRFEIDPLNAWRSQQMPNKGEDPALIAKGRQLFQTKTCIACHTVRGVLGAQGITGPDLTHVGARTTIAGGLLENTPEELRRWIHNPGAVKPGNKMAVGFLQNNIHLQPDEEVALVSFLESLK